MHDVLIMIGNNNKMIHIYEEDGGQMIYNEPKSNKNDLLMHISLNALLFEDLEVASQLGKFNNEFYNLKENERRLAC